MGLESLVQAGTQNNKANKVRLMLDDMTDRQRELFAIVIADTVNYSAPAVARACKGEGYDINGDQIRHFRRKLTEGSETL